MKKKLKDAPMLISDCASLLEFRAWTVKYDLVDHVLYGTGAHLLAGAELRSKFFPCDPMPKL